MRFESRIGVPPATYVDSPEKIEAALRRCFDSSFVAIDTETLGTEYGIFGDQIVNMGLCPDLGSRFFVPRRYLHRFKCLIEDPDIIKIFANCVFDMHRFATAGISVKGPIADINHMDWLYDEDLREGKHGLKHTSFDYLGITMDNWKDIVKGFRPQDIIPGHERWPRMLDYGTLDVWATIGVYNYLKEKLSNIYTDSAKTRSLMDLYWETEAAQLQCIFEMERQGVRVDVDFLTALQTRLEQEIADLGTEACGIAGRAINLNSTPQIAEYLFEDLKLEPIKKTPGGKNAADADVLKVFAADGNAFCQKLLELRTRTKMKSTYVDALLNGRQAEDKIHTSYSCNKRTGRFSSKGPNLQNIPHLWDFRRAFIADKRQRLIVSDYAQLEMRVMAHYSKDPNFCKGIREGRDMHSYTGALMLSIPYDEFIDRKNEKEQVAVATRKAAKAIGFGIMYGMGVRSLADGLQKALGREVSVEEAQEYLDQYLGAFPGIKVQIEAFKRSARERGYVQTITGRFRRLSKIRTGSFRERRDAERQAINSPIQGSGHDIVKHAMIRCMNDRALREMDCTIRLQVHDELVFSCPEQHCDEAARIIRHHMENPLPFKFEVPLTAKPDIVDSWFEAK